MQIIFDINPSHVTRVVDAVCATYNYDRTKNDGETRGEFTKRKGVDWYKDITLAHEADDAADVARDAVLNADGVDIT